MIDISTTLITYNRLEYTKQTIETYLTNTHVTHELIVVDNGSTDGTVPYLEELYRKKLVRKIILNTENKYPGAACNQGWDASSPSRFLHRSDNDLIYKLGWDYHVMRSFKAFPHMGQLGLVNELFQVEPKNYRLYDKYKRIKKNVLVYAPMSDHGNVGGPCVVPRLLYDLGLRWMPDTWTSNANEDAQMARYVRHLGYEIYELPMGIVDHIGYGDIQKYYDYYRDAYERRNLGNWFLYRLELEQRGKIQGGYTRD